MQVNQTEFEIARDLITWLRAIGEGGAITVRIQKKTSLFNWGIEGQTPPCGPRQAADAIAAAYLQEYDGDLGEKKTSLYGGDLDVARRFPRSGESRRGLQGYQAKTDSMIAALHSSAHHKETLLAILKLCGYEDGQPTRRISLADEFMEELEAKLPKGQALHIDEVLNLVREVAEQVL